MAADEGGVEAVGPLLVRLTLLVKYLLLIVPRCIDRQRRERVGLPLVRLRSPICDFRPPRRARVHTRNAVFVRVGISIIVRIGNSISVCDGNFADLRGTPTSPAKRLKSGLEFGTFLGWQRRACLSARVDRTCSRGGFELPDRAGAPQALFVSRFEVQG